MQVALKRIITLLNQLESMSNDSEFTDCVNEAIMHLESASDRLTAIEEELTAEVDELEDGEF